MRILLSKIYPSELIQRLEKETSDRLNGLFSSWLDEGRPGKFQTFVENNVPETFC